jgi:hypothetical protein
VGDEDLHRYYTPETMRRPTQQPFTRPITEALDASHMLGRLMERLRESEARFATIRPALPPAEEGWNLLVPNTAVAAKLRQSLPTLEQLLAEAGWPATVLRVKVQSTRP